MFSREREWAGLGRLINVLSEARDSSPPDQSPCGHYGYESCAAHQACQGHQGAGQDRFAGTVHAGTRRIHGRHEPFHHPKRERPRARGRRAHPIGVRARGSEAALNLGLGPGCLGRLPGPRG